jgi:hypothetical protein
MFARIENNQVAEYPLTDRQIKMRFPNVSFPSNFTSALPDGYERVQPSSQPAEDELKVITEGTPALMDGVWTQVWVQSDKYTAEELVAFNAKKDVDKRQEVRDVRNSLLAKSDWTQGKDIPDNVSSAWATYRQALRDVTEQSGFPWTIEWPTQPE